MERWDTLWDGGWTFCFDDGAFKPSTDSFLLGSFPPPLLFTTLVVQRADSVFQ